MQTPCMRVHPVIRGGALDVTVSCVTVSVGLITVRFQHHVSLEFTVQLLGWRTNICPLESLLSFLLPNDPRLFCLLLLVVTFNLWHASWSLQSLSRSAWLWPHGQFSRLSTPVKIQTCKLTKLLLLQRCWWWSINQCIWLAAPRCHYSCGSIKGGFSHCFCISD